MIERRDGEEVASIVLEEVGGEEVILRHVQRHLRRLGETKRRQKEAKDEKCGEEAGHLGFGLFHEFLGGGVELNGGIELFKIMQEGGDGAVISEGHFVNAKPSFFAVRTAIRDVDWTVGALQNYRGAAEGNFEDAGYRHLVNEEGVAMGEGFLVEIYDGVDKFGDTEENKAITGQSYH